MKSRSVPSGPVEVTVHSTRPITTSTTVSVVTSPGAPTLPTPTVTTTASAATNASGDNLTSPSHTFEIQPHSRRAVMDEACEVGHIQDDWIVYMRTDYSGQERMVEDLERTFELENDTVTHEGVTYTKGSIIDAHHDLEYLVYRATLATPMIPDGRNSAICDVSRYITGTFDENTWNFLEAKNPLIGKERWIKLPSEQWG